MIDLAIKIAGFNVEDGTLGDNLAIVLVSYFEGHRDKPEDDPVGEHGWGEWASEKCDEALALLAKQIEEVK
jgi:hypothetical protein